MTSLFSLPLSVIFFLIQVPCLALGLGGAWYIRKKRLHVDIADNQAVVLAHAFTGVIYAVAVALLVVEVQAGYTEVKMVAMHEASLAGDMFVDAEGLSSPAREDIQGLAQRYIETVIQEWPSIGEDEIVLLASHQVADELAYELLQVVPQSEKESIVYAELLRGLNDMLDQRRIRLHLGLDGIGSITWLVVSVGAFITIGMTWFYNTVGNRVQYGLVAAMTLMFGLMIFLIITMDHPLLGGFSVDSKPFQEALVDVEEWRTRYTTR